MNAQATANILFAYQAQMKTVKRNKSGTPNGNALNTFFPAYMKKLQEAGNTWKESLDMLNELTK